MSEKDLKQQAEEAAAPHLPPFCAIVEGLRVPVVNPKTRELSSVIGAWFTFPGATDHGFWRADLPEMATVGEADYATYQHLKEQWQQESKKP